MTDDANTARIYRAEGLIDFGTRVLMKLGFPRAQSEVTSRILVEADLRDIHSHGIAGGSSLDDIMSKLENGGIRIASPIVQPQKYGDIFYIDAQGGLGHYATDMACNLVIARAKVSGYAKAYVSDSTHFGIAGHYSEKIARADLGGKATCTSPVWTKSFSESGVYDEDFQKVLGTNPIAWSIPYNTGIITMDMATTQRAVSPAIKVAKENYEKLKELRDKYHVDFLGLEGEVKGLTSIGFGHFEHINEALKEKMGTQLGELPSQYVMDQYGREVKCPLAFDDYFKQNFWIAPLGGTVFGYKGFCLNFLIEADNIVGGGNPLPIPSGDQTAFGRVSQTVEAYALDGFKPLDEVKNDITRAVYSKCDLSGKGMKLPGQKEHDAALERRENGIPFTEEQYDKLVKIGEEVGIPFGN